MSSRNRIGCESGPGLRSLRARAQANLPAFAIAVLVVTTTATAAILTVDGAFVAADRQPVERARATGLADAMVDRESPLAVRSNVLNASKTADLDGELRTWFPAATGVDIQVTLGDTVLVRRGDPTGGTTVRRLVLVSRATPRTIEPVFTSSDTAVTLPRRASEMTLEIAPPGGTTVRAVRVDGRVVLHDPGGLDGRYRVSLSRFQTATIRFNVTGPLPPGSIRVEYAPAESPKAVLEVTVDA